MSSRRKSRNRSIVGNLNDIQKRIKYLEARQAPTQLARKVVATQNIALRAVQPEVIADAAIVRRTLAPESVISANLSVVGDPDGAAVATDNVQDTSITNEKLAGDIEDGKIIGISASKIGPDQLVDDQLEGISTEKLIGSVVDDQIDSISAIKIGPDLLVDDQIDGLSTSKLIGEITNDQLEGLITSDKIESVDATTITGLIMDDQIDGISGEKIIGGIDGALIVGRSIPADAIELNSLTEDEMATDSIGFDEIQVNAVGTAQLQENSVIGLIIDSLAIERRHMNDNVIISRMINAGAVQTEGIQNLAVTNGKIANTTITGAKIALNTITDAQLGAIGATVFESIGTAAPLGGFFAQGKANLRVTLGSGSTAAAAGNHVHGSGGYSAAGSTGVASHTHPISISSTASGGTHGGHTSPLTGSHTHTVSVSGTSGTPSTIKLKKEVSDYAMVDVKNLLNLNLKRYKYKNQARNLHEGREWMYGYIAEEVQELGIEEIVGYDENKEPNAINYGLLSTLVLELVKVQQTEIDSLKEEIQRLKEKI